MKNLIERLKGILDKLVAGEKEAAKWYRDHETTLRVLLEVVGHFPFVGAEAELALGLMASIDAVLAKLGE